MVVWHPRYRVAVDSFCVAKRTLHLWSSRNYLRFMVSPAIFRQSYMKNCVKGVHFANQSKENKYARPNYQRSNRRCLKSVEEDEDRKIYMRDIIGNIYKTLRYSTWDSAQEQLLKLPMKWDSYTVNQVLKTHPPLEKAWLFFNWAAQLKGFKHDQFTYTTMLDIFGEAGRISSMNFVFKQMQEKSMKIDAVTYTSLMHWISRSGDVLGAIKVWEEMKTNGCQPTVVSYTAYMKLLFDNNRVKEATDIYKEMLQRGCAPNCYTYTVLMEYLIMCGKCVEALDIFNQMQEAKIQPDKAACNILVEKLCKYGGMGMIHHVLQFMKENHLVLRYPVFVAACKSLEAAGKSDALLRLVNPQFAFESITNDKGQFRTTAAGVHFAVEDGLMLILLEKENLVAVDCLLAGTINKNIKLDSVVVSNIIKENCDRCRLEGALLAFEYCVKQGVCIDQNSYLALIGALFRSNLFPKLVEIVKGMIGAGHSLGIYLSASIINRLGHARRPTCAAKFFNLLPDDHKCPATYTALIGAYILAGSPEKGLKIFGNMQRKGILPSLGTYNVLLTGLAKSERVVDVEIYRKEKKRLQAKGNLQDVIPIEQKICDLLFAGEVVV